VLALFRDLFAHLAWADAAMIGAIARHEPAARDQDLRTLLHHILVSHRYWILTCLGLPFSADREGEVPDSLPLLASRFRETHDLEAAWLARVDEADLARILEVSFFPGRRIPLSDALMQVCLHSQGHRSQCATRLRLLGARPPTLDFILWLNERPAPVWIESAATGNVAGRV
jgi:uncharacterized damage-inducible protein DinB